MVVAVGLAIFAGLLTFRGFMSAQDSTDAFPIYRTVAEATQGSQEAAALSVAPLEAFFNGSTLTEKQLDDLRSADRLMTGVIAFDPNYYQAYVAVGRIQFAIGDYDQAELALREAVRLAPESPDAEGKMIEAETHYLLSRTVFEKRLYAVAIDEAEIAIALAPENVDNLTARAAALIQVGKPEEAAEDLKHVLDHQPQHHRANQLRKLLVGGGK